MLQIIKESRKSVGPGPAANEDLQQEENYDEGENYDDEEMAPLEDIGVDDTHAEPMPIVDEPVCLLSVLNKVTY